MKSIKVSDDVFERLPYDHNSCLRYILNQEEVQNFRDYLEETELDWMHKDNLYFEIQTQCGVISVSKRPTRTGWVARMTIVRERSALEEDPFDAISRVIKLTKKDIKNRRYRLADDRDILDDLKEAFDG